MENRELKINNLKFNISYMTDLSGLDKVNFYNQSRVIQVNFVPNEFLCEEKMYQMIDENKDELLNCIKEIINENKTYYDNFNYNLKFNQISSYLYRTNFNNLGVFDFSLTIDIKSKNVDEEMPYSFLLIKKHLSNSVE